MPAGEGAGPPAAAIVAWEPGETITPQLPGLGPLGDHVDVLVAWAAIAALAVCAVVFTAGAVLALAGSRLLRPRWVAVGKFFIWRSCRWTVVAMVAASVTRALF